MTSREAVIMRGIQLEYLTIGWNLLEATLGIAIGAFAGSVALFGFGLDSAIEVFSGAVVFWRLKSDRKRGEAADRTALRLVGASFLLLSAYIVFDAGIALLQRQAPQKSLSGIFLAIAAVLVMPLLARAKRRVAGELGSSAMRADSRQSDFCGYLSAILLAGLFLNATLRWWWADPIAALIMVPIIAKEGIEGLKGETCCQENPTLGCTPTRK